MALKFWFLSLGVFYCSAGLASTDCRGSVQATYVGQGVFWTAFIADGGTTAQGEWFPTSLPDSKAMMASIQVNKVLGKPITFRFAADGVNCATLSSRADVIGVWN